MSPLRAHVEKGRLVLDEPTTLPVGTVVSRMLPQWNAATHIGTQLELCPNGVEHVEHVELGDEVAEKRG
jgi:hypothetical protein